MNSEFIQTSYADWLCEVNYYVKQWTGYQLNEIAPLDYHAYRQAGISAMVTAERAVAGDDHWWGLQ